MISKRHEESSISVIDFFIQGNKRLLSTVEVMTEALLIEDNLVVANKQDAFRRQIGMAFSLETLDPNKK